MRLFEEVSLSPAGDRIAAVESEERFDVQGGPRVRGPVVVREARTGAALASLDPCPTCRYSGLTWSSDGLSLAFLAFDAERGRTTLEIARSDRVSAVASLDGVAQTPRFSPDGALIALLATPGAHKESGAVEAGAEMVGDIGILTTADERRIGVVSPTGGNIRYLSPADSFVYEYDWRPDGQGFVATAARGNGDDNWWVAKLIAVGLDGHSRVIASPKVQMNYPRVSPDGRTVAFVGGLMSDLGPSGGDLYTVAFAGGEAVDATPGLPATVTSLGPWRRDALTATLLRGDRNEIAQIDPHNGRLKVLWNQPVTTEAGDGHVSFSADGNLAAAAVQDFTHAPEIWFGPIGPSLGPVTRANAALPPQTQARSLSWKTDGYQVQGWLLSPLVVSPGRHPLVVSIHGGPSSATTPRYVPPSDPANFPVAQWLKRGYFVLYPNPRGSYGQGEAFTKANVRDFGGGDLRDILAGVDAAEQAAPIDDARLGVFGHSYGGYMTMWTVTHSHRFAAAISGAGIADWVSYYGQNGIDKWMVPFFGASAYDEPAIYQKLSPIYAVKAARTPTLLYVGERDVECPAAQSFEFWHALQELGVANSFVVYKGQGHAIRDPADLADLRQRELAWFDKYLGG